MIELSDEGPDFLKPFANVDGKVSGLGITLDGDPSYSGNRFYFVAVGPVHSNFLSHDIARFGNETLHLGSWYGPYRYLYRTAATDSPKKGDATTITLNGRYAGEGQCDDPYTDTTINISENSVKFHETSCDIISIEVDEANKAKSIMQLSCSGEGATWTQWFSVLTLDDGSIRAQQSRDNKPAHITQESRKYALCDGAVE